jgi:predicted O-linked N-acetylglucosamine transferase (SPINDLY family)
MLKKGWPTLGSFNQSRKITHTTAERWVAVLEAIPSSKLLLKSKNLGERTEEARVRELFEKLGLQRDRLKLVGHSATVAEHLDYYREIDIALDTFPYTGCTTTADALWMGVPVLTVAGTSMVSRQAAAVLAAAGYPEFICNSTEELVERCERIIKNPQALAKQREEMREKVKNSELLNAESLSKSFEEAFQSWWKIWLKREGWAETAGKAWPSIQNRRPQPLLCKIGTSPHWSNQI